MSSDLYEHVDLSGITVAITGAAGGIGRALAEGFRFDGATVVGGDLPSNLDALAEVCDVAVAVDVTLPGDNERLVAAAVKAGGRLDAFIANAGIATGGRFDAQPWDEISAVRTLAKELRDTDILVNNLIPGVSATGIFGSDEATPQIARDPALAYPTARHLATLPAGGPTGETWFDMERWPMWKEFDT